MKIETNILLVLLKLKKAIDANIQTYCIWSSVTRNPDTASFKYIILGNHDTIVKAKITEFNIPRLPAITFDDVLDLNSYIENNYETLNKLEKLTAFI